MMQNEPLFSEDIEEGRHAGLRNLRGEIIRKQQRLRWIKEHRKDKTCPYRPTKEAIKRHEKDLKLLELVYQRSLAISAIARRRKLEAQSSCQPTP